ncbi:DUF6912 family protein [Skermania piniformis]|uniref:Uncharacterized protein n=1 Tax=Skermania pinensis TaxID=39122 RepID=A0ABX8SGA2_9ACTN|nr:hypothetical protein [Skermania piniformis]QXQ15962.1 hypothetical protein KV203_15400 [Skermania piniformis]
MLRVYVPATVRMLRGLVAEGEFTAVNGLAFAITPMLREAYSSGTDEELAEVAMAEAARASLRLLAAELADDADAHDRDGNPVRRRAVVAADLDNVRARPDLDDAVVRISGPIPLARVGSVHVDLAEAEEAVTRAVEVIDAADLGDPDAEFVLGDAEDHQLAWYATQELPFLIELL